MLRIVSRTNFMSCRLAPATTTPTGTPAASHISERFTPSLPRSVGLGPVFSPAERGLGHRTVHAQPSPIQALQFVIDFQTTLPQTQKNARRAPFLKSPVGRRTGTNAGGVQGVPLTAGSQHKEDRVHGVSIIPSWPASTIPMRIRVLGQQRLHERPQFL